MANAPSTITTTTTSGYTPKKSSVELLFAQKQETKLEKVAANVYDALQASGSYRSQEMYESVKSLLEEEGVTNPSTQVVRGTREDDYQGSS